MKRRKVMKWLAAAVVGAVMLLPVTSSATTWLTVQRRYKPQLDATVPVMGLTATYVEGYKDNMDEEGVVVHWASAVPEGYTMCLEHSTDPAFANEAKTRQLARVDYEDNQKEAYSDNEELYRLEAGTNYVRAILYKWTHDSANNYYYAYNVSPAVEVSVPAPEARFSKTVSSTKVEFRFSTGGVTGYEIQRKVGSKFVKIARISDQGYTDEGLQKNKTYNYKIRTYVYNPVLQKTVYGDWVYTEATTWGRALNLKAVPGKKSTVVNLTWTKVPNASGYEIYRSLGGSTAPSKKGLSSSFGNMKLIKTITKAKTQKYTDKDLIAGNNYVYTVVAYKNVAGKNVKDLTLSDETWVSLGLDFDVVTNIENADGSRKVTWKKVVGAEGFKIMKNVQDPATRKWTWAEWTTLKASARSVTLPASATPGENDEYRIYAYAGAKKSDNYSFSTSNYSLRTSPGSIRATVVNGGTAVSVSWQPVEGAAYYKVYRSTSLPTYENNNADLGRYNGGGVPVYTAKQPRDENSYGWDYRTDKITAVSVTDEYIPYSNPKDAEGYYEPINQGPEPGMTYYYYVQAYRSDGRVLTSHNDVHYDAYDDVEGSWNADVGGYVYPAHYGYYGSLFAKPARVTLSQAVSLKAPGISSVKSKKKGQATIAWKSVSGAKTYYVYCATSKKAKNYMCAGTTTKTSLTVKGLDSGTTYYFKVKAAAGNEMSADTNMSKKYSGVKSVKVK